MNAIQYFGSEENQQQHLFRGFLGQFESIKSLFHVLEVLAIATKKVQEANFALTDLYGVWLHITMQLESSPHVEYSSILLRCLNTRKSLLLNHPAMVCGVFLDPRFYSELTPEQKSNARLMIQKVYMRLHKIKNKGEISGIDDISLVEKYFIEKCAMRPEAAVETHESEFNKELETYESNMKRLHSDLSVIDFWDGQLEESKRIANLHSLKEVAMNLVSIPSTQVPCERDFSHLAFVFSKYRSLLDQKLLEFILIIRLNADLWNDLKSEDRKKLLNSFEAS